jgi:hypothetical protein
MGVKSFGQDGERASVLSRRRIITGVPCGRSSGGHRFNYHRLPVKHGLETRIILGPLRILSWAALGAATILSAFARISELFHHILETLARLTDTTQIRWIGHDAFTRINEANSRINTLIPI